MRGEAKNSRFDSKFVKGKATNTNYRIREKILFVVLAGLEGPCVQRRFRHSFYFSFFVAVESEMIGGDEDGRCLRDGIKKRLAANSLDELPPACRERGSRIRLERGEAERIRRIRKIIRQIVDVSRMQLNTRSVCCVPLPRDVKSHTTSFGILRRIIDDSILSSCERQLLGEQLSQK